MTELGDHMPQLEPILHTAPPGVQQTPGLEGTLVEESLGTP
jgi:hypothetical protein